jgi:hypothetical protein
MTAEYIEPWISNNDRPETHFEMIVVTKYALYSNDYPEIRILW